MSILHTMSGYCYLTPVWDISILHTMSGYCYITPLWDISILHTMSGYCYLTRCGISLSYTLSQDTAISSRCGISLPFHLCCSRANTNPHPNYFLMTATITTQLNKPLPTIIFRTTYTIHIFNNHKQCLNKYNTWLNTYPL